MNTNTINKNTGTGTGTGTYKIRGGAVAVGNFDGFHLGHRKIIENLKQVARKKNLVSIIVTFTPNPKIYFKKEKYLIHTDAQKKKILESLGVDQVIMLNFGEIVDMSDEQFLKNFLIDRYNMKHIVMGENFRFGKGREGDIGFLQCVADRWDFGLTVVKSVRLDNQRISSTYIREKLAEAKIEEANRMLGRRYFIQGIVVEGDKVGAELGFPTINVETENTLLPEGVFKTTVQVDEKIYDSITYIGYRPTFSGKEKNVESHIFDFDRKIYGKRVNIYFEKKLRDDMKFDSKMSLIKQIKKDIENLKVDKGPIF
ncbi:MAG: bifunctional riboflavin kinase/FAD synthetase [Candidatus Aminicenantes bacterium]|nr:MAG: bifunctional riboflavin kinase/FAD synthetase [Candidatus Aminicenantes bacterium]